MWRKLKPALGLIALGAVGCYLAIYQPLTAMARGEDGVRTFTLGVFFAPALVLVGLMMALAAFLPDPQRPASRVRGIAAAVLMFAALGALAWFAIIWFPGEAERLGYR